MYFYVYFVVCVCVCVCVCVIFFFRLISKGNKMEMVKGRRVKGRKKKWSRSFEEFRKYLMFLVFCFLGI